MKLNKIFIYGILLAAASLTACEDEVMIGKANNPNLSVPGEVVYVTDPMVSAYSPTSTYATPKTYLYMSILLRHSNATAT